MNKSVRIMAAVSLLLILASFPTCYVGELYVQPELAKLSPGELEARQFDMEYVRYVLPGIGMFFIGGALALASIGSVISGYLEKRRNGAADPRR